MSPKAKKLVKGVLLVLFIAGVCIGARILISGGDLDQPTGMGAPRPTSP